MLPGIVTQELPIPPISASHSSTAWVDNYTVKYLKANVGDLGDLMKLQEVETKGLKGDEVVLLEKDKFTFMADYFIILKYMEKKGST